MNCFVVLHGKELVTFRTRDLEKALLVVRTGYGQALL